MKIKRFFYTVLLILFSLVLLADLGLWFLVPDAAAASQDESTFTFTPPEGMSLPEGVTFPGSGEGGENARRPSRSSTEAQSADSAEGSESSGRSRPSRSSTEAQNTDSAEGNESSDRRRPSHTGQDGDAQTSSDAETLETAEASPLKTWFSTKITELRQYVPLSELTPVKEIVHPYRLYILIGALLGMALCILRLAFLNRRIRQLRETQESEAAPLRRVALWPAFLLILAALGLVMFLFPATEEEQAEDGAVTNIRVLTGTAEEKDLTSLIQSAGYLEEQESVSLTIPASVTISSVCVHNGDFVTAGQIVAKADKTDLMKAISSIHEVLADIDSQLQEAHEARGEKSIKAPTAGTVKMVYAEVGETTLDVMNEHESLMLLSLDGRMAVQIPAADDLVIGSTVTVTLSDGADLTGEVSFLEEGVATVTVVDRGYAIGEQAAVRRGDGTLLGSGPLYVHKALNITGYLGTVVRIYRGEGRTVEAGVALIGLSNTADLADYQDLLRQRSTYEAELKTLFEIYEDGYIHAPCDGVIEGLSETLTYTSLSNMATGVTARYLASGPADAEPAEFYNFLAEVESVDGNWLRWIKGKEMTNLTSYSALPKPSGAETGEYTIPASAPIYLLSGGWNPISADDTRPGDKILFTFDVNGSLVWVIVEHTASVTPSPTPASSPSPTPSPTPSGTVNPSGPPEGTPGPSGSPGGGRPGGGRISFGRGGANSTPKPSYIIAEKELCTVTPQERMLITVSIDELDVLALSLGQEADLYLDALPATGFTATVTKIDPEGENSGGNTKYSVTLVLDRSPQLYPGMNGTVCFPRKERQKAVTVPLAALQEDGSRTVIYTAYDAEKDQLVAPVEIQTGLSDGTDVEILSGLALGDTYYYRYADSISYVTE